MSAIAMVSRFIDDRTKEPEPPTFPLDYLGSRAAFFYLAHQYIDQGLRLFQSSDRSWRTTQTILRICFSK